MGARVLEFQFMSPNSVSLIGIWFFCLGSTFSTSMIMLLFTIFHHPALELVGVCCFVSSLVGCLKRWQQILMQYLKFIFSLMKFITYVWIHVSSRMSDSSAWSFRIRSFTHFQSSMSYKEEANMLTMSRVQTRWRSLGSIYVASCSKGGEVVEWKWHGSNASEALQ